MLEYFEACNYDSPVPTSPACTTQNHVFRTGIDISNQYCGCEPSTYPSGCTGTSDNSRRPVRVYQATLESTQTGSRATRLGIVFNPTAIQDTQDCATSCFVPSFIRSQPELVKKARGTECLSGRTGSSVRSWDMSRLPMHSPLLCHRLTSS